MRATFARPLAPRIRDSRRTRIIPDEIIPDEISSLATPTLATSRLGDPSPRLIACLVFEGLFVTPAVTAIVEALESANANGKIFVVGNAKLASALAKKRDVITLSSGDIELAAVVGTNVATDDNWETTLREWTRIVRDGGVLVFVDRGHAAEASRRALCAGLTEIEQRHAGRVVVTSGLVTHLAVA